MDNIDRTYFLMKFYWHKMNDIWLSEAEVAQIIGLKNVNTLKTWRWAGRHKELRFSRAMEKSRKIYYERESVFAFADKYKIRMIKREENKNKAALRKRGMARKEV